MLAIIGGSGLTTLSNLDVSHREVVRTPYGEASGALVFGQICGKPAVQRFKPFCSARCADIDLGRWLKEGYRIETNEGPGEDDPAGGAGPSGQRS